MLTARKELPTKKRFDQNRGDEEERNSSRDGSVSPASRGSKRQARCEPDETMDHSPKEHVRIPPTKKSYYKKESYPEPMDTDSPSTYPKHVIVPSSLESSGQRSLASYHEHMAAQTPPSAASGSIVTPPILTNEPSSFRNGFYPGGAHLDPYAKVSPYSHHSDMDLGATYANHSPNNVHLRPKRWACDFCCVATFLTFEEACAHEQTCSRNHDRFGQAGRLGMRPTKPQQAMNKSSTGALGALAYHASKELQLGTPLRGGTWALQNRRLPSSEAPRYPSLSPRFQEFRLSAYEGREGAHSSSRLAKDKSKRMLLALAGDSDSLSDRQCYVRSEFVEVFTATEHDVAARHSKGAQKLAVGQVGIRCIHCSHLQPKDRAERAVCYPSSISRIYQTVADMQRFHFEQCHEIPDETRKIYKSLKTTRPRGVGSPQTYWIQSAKLLNLIDTDDGIRFGDKRVAAKV